MSLFLRHMTFVTIYFLCAQYNEYKGATVVQSMHHLVKNMVVIYFTNGKHSEKYDLKRKTRTKRRR